MYGAGYPTTVTNEFVVTGTNYVPGTTTYVTNNVDMAMGVPQYGTGYVTGAVPVSMAPQPCYTTMGVSAAPVYTVSPTLVPSVEVVGSAYPAYPVSGGVVEETVYQHF